jgi:hypothetical protein
LQETQPHLAEKWKNVQNPWKMHQDTTEIKDFNKPDKVTTEHGYAKTELYAKTAKRIKKNNKFLEAPLLADRY